MNPDQYLSKQVEKWDIHWTQRMSEQFSHYYDLLVQTNQKFNLTAITDPFEVYQKHFADSVSCLQSQMIHAEDKVIDIGSGAGFPGIPIKIVKPSIQLTCLDSLNKRVVFLQDLVESLVLKEVTCIHARAEDLARKVDHRMTYDVAVSRAVSNLASLLELTSPFVRQGGHLILQKGPQYEEELKGARKAMHLLHVEYVKTEIIELDQSDRTLYVLIFQKTGKTPKTYPRKAGTPVESPLQ